MPDRYAGHEGGTLEDVMRAGYRYNALPRPAFGADVVARAARYLNFDLAAEVTGNALDIDGGRRMLPT